MTPLTPDECRVLGVLIEKAQTTPQQYPLSVNALTLGCNQKNNRHPVVEWDEERVYSAVDSLRAKGLVREANLTGSRVPKFRHVAREVFSVDTPELVVLAELMLRGHQSAGELRQNASRMHPIEGLDAAQTILNALAARQPPMTRELPRRSGERATRWRQLLCPELHQSDESAPVDSPAHPELHQPRLSGPATAQHAPADLRIAALESEVHELRSQVADLTRRIAAAGL
jgi:uncharacterized protein YceH (UPF0502 family)